MSIYKPVPGLVAKTSVSPGTPVLVLPSGMLGNGFIYNPLAASDQRLDVAEVLYVSQVAPVPFGNPFDVIPGGPPPGARIGFPAGTVVKIQPGASMSFFAGSTQGVYAWSASSEHYFTAFYTTIASNYPPSPVPGSFPPSSTTTMTKVIPSYLYKQYDDDDDLQAFVASYNALGQEFIDTINGLNLPIYTGDNISGALLDWVGAGIYGIFRTPLSSYNQYLKGPFNTYEFNTLGYNMSGDFGPPTIIVTTDDTYKRILTWAILKGDGKVCSVRWLKRRVMRFLTGKNGTNPNIDQTYQISITFGPNNEIAIKFIDEITTRGFGAIFDGFAYNTAQYDEQEVTITPLVPLPYRDIFQDAVLSGAIELPFQFTFNVYL